MKKQEITIGGVDTNIVSDGYHTFGELYAHRITLWIALCRFLEEATPGSTWRSRKHSDGSEFKGWFVLGYRLVEGKQITYHLPEDQWTNCYFADWMASAPAFDGHTPEDALRRISELRP